MMRFFAGLACISLPRPTCAAIFRKSVSELASVTSPFALPELGFPYDALEDIFVGSQTMHLHHDKHHAFYVNTLNKAIAGHEEASSNIETLVGHIRKLPAEVQGVVRNHG